MLHAIAEGVGTAAAEAEADGLAPIPADRCPGVAPACFVSPTGSAGT